jgi:hypothetical protein
MNIFVANHLAICANFHVRTGNPQAIKCGISEMCAKGKGKENTNICICI